MRKPGVWFAYGRPPEKCQSNSLGQEEQMGSPESPGRVGEQLPAAEPRYLLAPGLSACLSLLFIVFASFCTATFSRVDFLHKAGILAIRKAWNHMMVHFPDILLGVCVGEAHLQECY